MNKQTRHLFGLLAVVAVLAAGTAWCSAQQTQPAAGEPVTTLRTWAVLASDELRKSGLDDLIMAGLGTDRTITLVDREHLALVAKELALSSLLETSGASSRRKAGAAIRADALAILNLESAGGESFVRLVICETRAGARLLVECVAYKADKPDLAAKAILAAIDGTRRRFPEGVRRVYAVAPFVSRNLGHEYDYLQRGIASLLANALSCQDGMAVIEIDEARRIAREIAVTDGKDIHRIVPLFIEGEYEVTIAGPDKEPAVRFGVKVAGNGSPVNVPAREVKLSEMAGYLSSALPAVILGSSVEKDKPLTADQQVSALVARADVFARLGSWEHSAALREAALLLKDSPPQRKLLVDEYRKMVTASLPWGMKIGQGEGYRELCRQRWESWRLALAHLEYLVRNKQVDARWAPGRAGWLFKIAYRGKIRLAPKEDLARAESTRRRFLRDLYVPMSQLTINAKPAISWWRRAYSQVAYRRLDHRRLNKEDLDFYYDMMVNVFSPNDHFRRLFLYYPRDFSGVYRRFDCGVEEFLAFLDRLEKSDRPANRIVARLSRLHLKWTQMEHSDSSLSPLFNETLALHKELNDLPEVRKANRGMNDCLVALRRSIEQRILSRLAATRPRPSFSHTRTPPDETGRQVTLHSLDLQVRDMSGKLSALKGKRWRINAKLSGAGSMRLLNCGYFDVIWHEGVVLLHRQKGVLDEAIVDPNATFGDVQWDGRQIWVCARSGNIRILSPNGKEICRVTNKHGLPPCDQALKLHPLGSNKAIAIGSFGPHQRLWCGVVDINGDKPRVTVFHEATRVRTAEDPEYTGPDLATSFAWLHAHQWAQNGPKMLLVGRRCAGAPLEIDLSTLNVTLSKATVFPSAGYWGMYSHDGYIVQVRNHYPVLVAPPGKTFSDDKDYRHLGRIYGSAWASPVLYWRDRLYVPGYPWFRIKPGTWDTERLDCQSLRINSVVAKWGVSAHYGIVAWGVSDNPWYRAVIADVDAADYDPDSAAVKHPASAASNR